MDDSDRRAARVVLGLPPDATRHEAQRAFRRLARLTHPDAGGDAAAFRAVAAAWAELSPRLPTDPRPTGPAASGPGPERCPAASGPGPERSPAASGPEPRWYPAAAAPHLAAYRPAASGRVVWAERRPPVRRDFATVLQAEMDRLAA